MSISNHFHYISGNSSLFLCWERLWKGDCCCNKNASDEFCFRSWTFSCSWSWFILWSWNLLQKCSCCALNQNRTPGIFLHLFHYIELRNDTLTHKYFTFIWHYPLSLYTFFFLEKIQKIHSFMTVLPLYCVLNERKSVWFYCYSIELFW